MVNNVGLKHPFNIVVIVAALGYFVDIYDLILFGIVKDPSLRALGIPEDQLTREGVFLLNVQMFGMFLGGIVWGVLGDKRGRLSTLFFTILLYSLANIANGFVVNTSQYAWMRFIAGFGLAGELGIGITLVAEVMTKESRGLGASIVSAIGIAGAVLGFVVNKYFDWKMAYWVGGGLGLTLLTLRVLVHESGMFHKTKNEAVERGNFFSLFTDMGKFKRYLLSILVGVPVWYTVSILAINAPVFAKGKLEITGEVTGGTSVMLHYIGASLGSILFGLLSQFWRSRKKAIVLAIALIGGLTATYFLLFGASSFLFYTVMFLIGIPMGGLWAIFMTTSSEQFGTNIRATVTTSAPNFVRGSTVLITSLWELLTPGFTAWGAAFCVGGICIVISLIASFMLNETYGRNLDYVE